MHNHSLDRCDRFFKPYGDVPSITMSHAMYIELTAGLSQCVVHHTF